MTAERIFQSVDLPLFRSIGSVADQRGQRAFVVGGFVRDVLLDRPTKDIDIVVEGNGLAFAEALAGHLEGSEVTYFKNFGTAMFRTGDIEIEVVGARKESYRAESRKPIVEDGTLDEDRQRRDFTINAMSIALNKDQFGELIDPLCGREHLSQRLLVTPLDPTTTFSDDPLRMMRAVRFACQLDFEIAEPAIAAMAAMRDRIAIVSQERVIEELNKIIASPGPGRGFKLLFNAGILHHIFPKMVELYGVDTVNGHAHKDNFYHTLQVLDNVASRSEDLWLRWGAILHDIAKPDTKRYEPEHGWTFHGHEEIGARMVPRLFRQLKLPLDHKMKFVQKMVRLHLRPIALSSDKVSDSGIRRLLFDAGEDLEALMILCESDITSKNEMKVERFLRNFEKVRQKCREVEASDHLREWQPPVGGQEIMDIFGLKPGKEIGILKTAVREAILEGEIANNREDALAFLYRKAAEIGLKPTIEPQPKDHE